MMDDSFGMDANLSQPNLPPALVQFDQTCERIAMGLVGARVRTRALIELLDEKGVLGGSDFDQRAEAIWERDYDALSGELLAPLESPPEEAEQAAGAQPTPSPLPNPSQYYTGALLNFVDDAVAGRVRLRAIIELLEQRGVFDPGEFDQKAEAIWERDYEALALEYYKGNY